MSSFISKLKNFLYGFKQKFLKSYPKDSMQASPYKGHIIPVGTSFAGQDLRYHDFTGTDFSNCDMKDAILTSCIFDKADLSQAQNLKEKQFIACSLVDTKLPENFKFSFLENFDKMMTQARDIFALSLSTSLFGIIAVMSTADEDFLVGGKSLTMPLIGVSVDMLSLYIFLPVTIMAVGLYLNVYMNKVQSIIKKFPHYLPDGREIHLSLYPWLWNYVSKPLYLKHQKQKLSYKIFALLADALSYCMLHVTSGLAIMIITFTYFKVQDPIMTTFHLIVFFIVTLFAFLHFRIKYKTKKFAVSFLMPISAFAFTVIMALCGSFVYLEKPIFVNVHDDPNREDEESASYKESFFYKIGTIYDIFFNSYITMSYGEISKNSSGCIIKQNKINTLKDEQEDKECQTVIGADLRNRNMINLNAPNSFFAKALLQNTNLQNANLQNADLRWADLSYSNLKNVYSGSGNFKNSNFIKTNLENINLIGANLQKATFYYANLKNAFLSGINAENATFVGSDLEDANFLGANLQYTDFRYTHLTNTDFRVTNLQSSDFTRAKSKNTNFNSINMQNSNFIETDLQNSTLQGTNLKNTILIGTNLSNIYFDNETKFDNAFYNTQNLLFITGKFSSDLIGNITIFPPNFNPSEKGMIDVCTVEGKNAFQQAIQNNQYKKNFEKNYKCIPIIEDEAIE